MQPHTLLHKNCWKICNACGNFIVVTKQEILVISLTDFFDAVSRRNDVILLPTIRRVSGHDFVFQHGSAPAHRTAHVQQLNCCVKKRQTFLRSSCGLQTAQISILWITRSGLSRSIVSTNQQCGWIETAAHRCPLRSWTVDFWRGYWPVARNTSTVCPC